MCDILNKFDNNGAVGNDSEDIMASPSQNSPMANVSTNSVPSNVGNSSNSGTNTLASNNNNSNSSNNGAGSSSNTSATSKPATAAESQPISQLERTLTKPRLLELVPEVDISAQLDEDVEELLLQVVKGLQLKSIFTIANVNQKAGLEPYISVNTNSRKVAKNEFEENSCKLINNAVYGKIMENVEKRRDVRLISNYEERRNSEGYRALIAKSNFKRIKRVNIRTLSLLKNRIK
ncbi:uncharacterized protein ACN2A1_010009 [Glossina fuscipes fuscipes]